MEIPTIKGEISILEWKQLVKNKEIRFLEHAHFKMSTRQRKAYKYEELMRTIQRETPRGIFLQDNNRYVAHYRKDDCYERVIIECTEQELIIITFMRIKELPRKTP